MSENLERKMESLPENIIIPNPERLEETKRKMVEQGPEKLHVISDFDRTLTQCTVDGQRSPTVIAQVRNAGYLGKDYVDRAHALYDHYHPIEINPDISEERRSQEMMDWWTKHFDLLIEKGITRDIINEVVAKRTLKFREGALDFLDTLHEKNIPLVIMSSSGLGDALLRYLEQEGKLHNNIHAIVNFFEFNKDGVAVAIKGKIIHPFNKNELTVKDLPIYEELKKRKNVILLGDGIADTGMAEGFDYENMIKIGFLNENIDQQLEDFKKNFDVIIAGDSSTDYANNLIAKIAY